ncbi:hypothetical protein [Allokutzneria albata]|uniref:Uncharacterized protein n=1 Tax=Allokutzneria albata TaxID=211114 RepID=A0A1H0D0H0_ALLAB|nr:hypothetical protein [Allokutzneria albata]SDN63361.1 hypothetical protein SAMN04489726_7507 [Allokutzneria albata]
MTLVERRYRRMLRVLPRWYRAEREEEMVSAFLEDVNRDPDADLRHDFGWPGWGEFGSLIALSARTRWPGRTGSPRALVKGQVVRLIGLIGLLLASASALNQWLSWIVPKLNAINYYGADGRFGHYHGPAPLFWNWRLVLNVFLDGASLLAFLALLFGAWRVAKTGAVAALLALVALMAYSMAGPHPFSLPELLFYVICALYPLCVLVGFHSDVAPFKPKWWLVALVGITALWMGLGWATWVLLDVSVLIGAAAYLVAHYRRVWRGPAAGLLAVAVICALEALNKLIWTSAYLLRDPSTLAVVAIEVAGLVAMAVWLRAQAAKVLPPETRSPLTVAG